MKQGSVPKLSPYPFGFNFAFTITDDPDGNTLEKIKPVYDYLRKTGIAITTAVWIFKGNRSNGIPDFSRKSWSVDTCERKDYLAYIQQLKKEGFEIALHGVSPGNDRRDWTIRGYEKFKDYFGAYPKMNIMHAENLENIYWGKKVVSNKILQFLIGIFIKKSEIPFSGDDPLSEYFWGDILMEKTKYVRLFGTSDINTLKFNPSMPYHDNNKPYVNYWFSFSDGFGVKEFNNLISKDKVDKLVKDRGACLVYTHFAHGFVSDGKLNGTFQRRMNYLISQRDGWFVPASDILDRLLLMKKVILTKEKNRIMVVNLNTVEIEGVTVIVPFGRVWYDPNGREYAVNDEGEIILENLDAGGAVVLLNNNPLVLRKEKRHNSTDNRMTVINFGDAIYILKKNGTNFERLFNGISFSPQLFDVNGQEVSKTKNGQYVAFELTCKKGSVFFKNKRVMRAKEDHPGRWENFKMVFQRALLYIKHNKGKLGL